LLPFAAGSANIGDGKRRIWLGRFFEIALALVCFDHIASHIVEADHGVPIGFCLIRRSSGNPIVCFYQSNQISAHSQRKAKARFGLWLGLTSGGRRELPPLFLPGD
jgi:hypothetical protein